MASPSRGAPLGLVDALVQLSFLVHNTYAEIAAEHELSIVQTRMLTVLREQKPTVGELGDLLGLDPAAVTELVDRSQRRGLITRTASKTDRRAYQVVATCAGHRLIAQVTTRFAERVQAMASAIPEGERLRLVRAATRIVAADAARTDIDPPEADAGSL